MKIKIKNIINNNNYVLVDFSSKYGCSVARWSGEIPRSGGVYDVELEIDDDFVWGVNIFETAKSRILIALEDGKFVIVGSVITLETDGCLSITVGDSVILLDVENAPADISGLVELHALDVTLYCTNL